MSQLLRFFLWLTLAAIGHLSSAKADRPSFVATRTGKAPVIDGHLDDPVWQLSKASQAFTQKQPNPGSPPEEPTTLRILYDDEAIYVGFHCIQKKVPIVARLSRRDRWIESDAVTITLDTRRDGQTAFEFIVNAASLQIDLIRFNDTDDALSWDENWDARAVRTRNQDGWSAEFKIPLRILRFDGVKKDQALLPWGMQAKRYTSMRQEMDEWAYIAPDVSGEVSRYGRLDGLRGLAARHPMELRAFVVGRMARLDSLHRPLQFAGSAGLDLKWHLSQNLTLDATINPDFGQVEADQVILNLNNFELFYPEKRPFFLEGIDTFSTPFSLLYTRRIGLAPPTPALPQGEELLDAPLPTTIYGAAKLIGTFDAAGGKAGQFTFGTLVSLTAQNQVNVRRTMDGDGMRRTRLAEPMTLWGVLRLRYAPRKDVYLGAISTLALRLSPRTQEADNLLCPDGTLVQAGQGCFRDAFAFGMDFRWRAQAGVVVSGQAVATVGSGGPQRLLGDGTTLSSGEVAPAAQLQVAKENGHVIFDSGLEILGRKVDFNDVGYMQRQNLLTGRLMMGFRTLKPIGRSLNGTLRLEFWDKRNLDGLSLGRGYQINTWWRFTTFWELYAAINYRPAFFDDRELGDGTALERRGRYGFEIAASSDQRKVLSFDLWASILLLEEGMVFESDGVIRIRPFSRLDIELRPQVLISLGEPRLVGPRLMGCAYRDGLRACEGVASQIFGRLSAKSVGGTLRASLTFTPRLSLQVYGQLLASSRRYSEYFSHPGVGVAQSGLRLLRLADLRPEAGPQVQGDNPDRLETALNVNVTLRWEFLLGSTIFLVYTRSQAPSRTPDLFSPIGGDLDLGLLTQGGATDVVLLKFLYWWS